jgi:hypothetical protein
MLLKKSVARAEYAPIESRRAAFRINVARWPGFLNQSCRATRSKSFFNGIGHERRFARVVNASAFPHHETLRAPIGAPGRGHNPTGRLTSPFHAHWQQV